MLLARGDAGFLAERGQVLADIFGSDADELEPSLFTPGEKPIDGVAIGATRVLIPDRTVEKFFGGEDGRLAGTVNDVRQRVDAPTARFSLMSVCLQIVHNNILYSALSV